MLPDALSYSLLIVILVVIGFVIEKSQLWTGACNWTIPWLCSTMALALCIVLAARLLSGNDLSDVPIRYLLGLYLPIVIVAGVGIGVDSYARRSEGPNNLFVCMAEWVGFSIILLTFMFWPRLLN